MSAISSRAKIAAISAAILGAALSMFLLRKNPAPAPVSSKPAEQPAAAADPPLAFVTTPAAPQAPAKTARTPSASTARRAAAAAAPAERALSFDVPECSNLALVSVARATADDAVATVRTGESDPEQVRVGDLLEGGEVIFIGTHPETRAPIVLLEDDAKVACRAVGQSPVASLRRVGPASPRDFSARTTDPGDPHRVEKLALKVPPGTTAPRADFESAAAPR
jgi:hypothetical protein